MDSAETTGTTEMTWAASRRALHAAAETVLAGPQYRRSGTIRLAVGETHVTAEAPPASETPTAAVVRTVAEPALTIRADTTAGTLWLAGTPFPLDPPAVVTTTCAALAETAGVDPGAPAGLYHDGSGVTVHEEVTFVAAHIAAFLDRLAVGAAALRHFAPDRTPVLWPEHFDVAVTLDEVNYGVSLGDGYSPEPYAYVGPWTAREGAFWNAPFGAVRTLAALGEDPKAVAEFFAEGQQAAHGGS